MNTHTHTHRFNLRYSHHCLFSIINYAAPKALKLVPAAFSFIVTISFAELDNLYEN